MNLIRIFMVLLLGLGVAACGDSDSSNTEPAMDKAADVVETAETVETAASGTDEEATEESAAVGFVRGVQETVDKAKEAAKAIEDAAQDTADQIGEQTAE